MWTFQECWQAANKLPTNSPPSQLNSKQTLFVGEMLARCQQTANISKTLGVKGFIVRGVGSSANTSKIFIGKAFRNFVGIVGTFLKDFNSIFARIDRFMIVPCIVHGYYLSHELSNGMRVTI
jgi:hypothetical protein